MNQASSIIMPGSWAEWSNQVANQPSLRKSGAILRQAEKFGEASGISHESATAMLLWLGSVAMLNFTTVDWPSGIWHPSALAIAVVEKDDVPIDTITTGFINMSRKLGLDPIQDTVKEGPSGLIARLESSRNRFRVDTPAVGTSSDFSLKALAEFDTANIDGARPENIGNVRGLIYPSGRSFLSYLYDTPFFNAIDELIQHGSLHVRGKLESHSLKNVNLATFLPFYQGALANMLGDSRVQSNFNMLLRQMLVFWPTSQPDEKARRGNIGSALAAVSGVAAAGIETLTVLMPPCLSAVYHSNADEPLFEPGVGIRYVTINRHEKLTRLAVSVAFWRLAEGDLEFRLTEADYAVADAILHGHEMGSRIVEIASSKGKTGQEMLRMLVSLNTEMSALELSMGLSQLSDGRAGVTVMDMLYQYGILADGGMLHDSYRLVNGDVIAAHRKRWKY